MIIYSINFDNLFYTIIFLTTFVISYFVLLYSNLEKLFKQGAIIPIRIAQVLLALIIAYFVAQGIYSLYSAKQ